MTSIADSACPSRITKAILELRAAYAERGLSLYDINNGWCDAFADDLLTMVIGKDWTLQEGRDLPPGAPAWHQVESLSLFAPLPGETSTQGAEAWDWPLIERLFGITVPAEDRGAMDAIVDDFLAHVWVWFDGRHYDCDHPEGVENFFDLAFFQRHLGRMAPSGTAIA